MAFMISATRKASVTQRPVTDGEYSVVIKDIVGAPANGNPYITVALEDGRTYNVYINSEVSLNIIEDDINRQLENFDKVYESDFDWFDDVKGKSVTLWIMPSADGIYHNPTFRKPSGFEAFLNGAL